MLGRAAGVNRLVGRQLEADEVGLAHDSGIDVVHRRGQQLPSHEWILLLGQQPIGQQHLGEDRGGLGQRQGRMLGQQRMVLGHHAVDRMTQLVGQSGHIPHPAGVVDQDPRRHAGEYRGTEGTTLLAATIFAVDVLFAKDPLGLPREDRIKVSEGPQNHLHGLAVGHLTLRLGQGCIDVVPAKLAQTQPLGLQPEKPLKQPSALPYHPDESGYCLVGNVVGEIAHADG